MYHHLPLTGVKGRIQTRVIQNEDGSKKKKTEIIASKVTFLAQSPNNKERSAELAKETKKQKSEKKKN